MEGGVALSHGQLGSATSGGNLYGGGVGAPRSTTSSSSSQSPPATGPLVSSGSTSGKMSAPTSNGGGRKYQCKMCPQVGPLDGPDPYFFFLLILPFLRNILCRLSFSLKFISSFKTEVAFLVCFFIGFLILSFPAFVSYTFLGFFFVDRFRFCYSHSLRRTKNILYTNLNFRLGLLVSCSRSFSHMAFLNL